MKVLHVTPYYAPAWAYGGVVRAVTELSRAQVAAGHRVFVLTTDTLDRRTRAPDSSERMAGVEVIRVRNLSNRLHGALNLATPARFGRRARGLLEAEAFDVVHAHELRTILTLQALAAARVRRVPVVLSPHGTLSYATGRRALKRFWDRLFGSWSFPRIGCLVAVTAVEAAAARALWQGFGTTLADDRIAVVPNGVRLDEFAQLPSPAQARRRWRLGDGPVVLFLGRLTERKRADLLVEAFAEACGAVPDARLLIAGPDEGAGATLRGLVAARGLGSRVVFAGLVTGDARLDALAAADVFALPAIGEGLSVAALEAMACGRPAALSPECGIAEIEAFGGGRVVSGGVRAWADALRTLLGDRETRMRMGPRARQLALERYAWPAVVERLDAVYRRAAELSASTW